MTAPTYLPVALPPQHDFYVLDVEDIIDQLKNDWIEVIFKLSDKQIQSQPDISYIVGQVIEIIRQDALAKSQIKTTLFVDISAIVQYEVDKIGRANWREAYMCLTQVVIRFGTELTQRIKSYGIYRDGYFPYRFAGWMGESVLVQLDEAFHTGDYRFVNVSEIEPAHEF